jgi:hypothetical protein
VVGNSGIQCGWQRCGSLAVDYCGLLRRLSASMAERVRLLRGQLCSGFAHCASEAP